MPKVILTLLRCGKVPRGDRLGLSDPYMVMKLPTFANPYRSPVKMNTLSPTWSESESDRRNSTWPLFLTNLHHTIQLELWDWDRFSPDDKLATGTFNLGDLGRLVIPLSDEHDQTGALPQTTETDDLTLILSKPTVRALRLLDGVSGKKKKNRAGLEFGEDDDVNFVRQPGILDVRRTIRLRPVGAPADADESAFPTCTIRISVRMTSCGHPDGVHCEVQGDCCEGFYGCPTCHNHHLRLSVLSFAAAGEGEEAEGEEPRQSSSVAPHDFSSSVSRCRCLRCLLVQPFRNRCIACRMPFAPFCCPLCRIFSHSLAMRHCYDCGHCVDEPSSHEHFPFDNPQSELLQRIEEFRSLVVTHDSYAEFFDEDEAHHIRSGSRCILEFVERRMSHNLCIEINEILGYLDQCSDEFRSKYVTEIRNLRTMLRRLNTILRELMRTNKNVRKRDYYLRLGRVRRQLAIRAKQQALGKKYASVFSVEESDHRLAQEGRVIHVKKDHDDEVADDGARVARVGNWDDLIRLTTPANVTEFHGGMKSFTDKFEFRVEQLVERMTSDPLKVALMDKTTIRDYRSLMSLEEIINDFENDEVYFGRKPIQVFRLIVAMVGKAIWSKPQFLQNFTRHRDKLEEKVILRKYAKNLPFDPIDVSLIRLYVLFEAFVPEPLFIPYLLSMLQNAFIDANQYIRENQQLKHSHILAIEELVQLGQDMLEPALLRAMRSDFYQLQPMLGVLKVLDDLYQKVFPEGHLSCSTYLKRLLRHVDLFSYLESREAEESRATRAGGFDFGDGDAEEEEEGETNARSSAPKASAPSSASGSASASRSNSGMSRREQLQAAMAAEDDDEDDSDSYTYSDEEDGNGAEQQQAPTVVADTVNKKKKKKGLFGALGGLFKGHGATSGGGRGGLFHASATGGKVAVEHLVTRPLAAIATVFGAEEEEGEEDVDVAAIRKELDAVLMKGMFMLKSTIDYFKSVEKKRIERLFRPFGIKYIQALAPKISDGFCAYLPAFAEYLSSKARYVHTESLRNVIPIVLDLKNYLRMDEFDFYAMFEKAVRGSIEHDLRGQLWAWADNAIEKDESIPISEGDVRHTSYCLNTVQMTFQPLEMIYEVDALTRDQDGVQTSFLVTYFDVMKDVLLHYASCLQQVVEDQFNHCFDFQQTGSSFLNGFKGLLATFESSGSGGRDQGSIDLKKICAYCNNIRGMEIVCNELFNSRQFIEVLHDSDMDELMKKNVEEGENEGEQEEEEEEGDFHYNDGLSSSDDEEVRTHRTVNPREIEAVQQTLSSLEEVRHRVARNMAQYAYLKHYHLYRDVLKTKNEEYPMKVAELCRSLNSHLSSLYPMLYDVMFESVAEAIFHLYCCELVDFLFEKAPLGKINGVHFSDHALDIGTELRKMLHADGAGLPTSFLDSSIDPLTNVVRMFHTPAAQLQEELDSGQNPELEFYYWRVIEATGSRKQRARAHEVLPDQSQPAVGSLVVNQLQETQMKLLLTLHRAENVPKMDSGRHGKADPYVVFHYREQTKRSKHCRNTLEPDWGNAKFIFLVEHDLAHEVLDLQFYDWDRFASDDLIGTVRIQLGPIARKGMNVDHMDWYTVEQGQGSRILMSIKFQEIH